MKITISETSDISEEDLLGLNRANGCGAANKPAALRKGLVNSHTFVTAWDGHELVGLGNAISDG